MPARQLSTTTTAVVTATLWLGGCTETAAPDPAEPDLESRIEAAVAPYVAPEDPVRAVLAVVDGETVYEEYFDSSRDEYRDVFSVTKSVMSTLVGIAIDEGAISGVEATLGELLPDYADDMSPRVSRTTLRQVLTMTAGFAGVQHDLGWNYAKEQDPVRRILADSAVIPPGREFVYSDPGAHLTAPVLEEATGMEVAEYARSRLFEPLGIPAKAPEPPLVFPDDEAVADEQDFGWPVDRDDYNLGYAHLRLRPVDMAKLGELYRQEGAWDGRRVVPAAWVREATTGQVPDMDVGVSDSYGYLWWTRTLAERSSYLASGLGGQRVEVVPDLDLVVVISTEVTDPDMRGTGISGTHADQIADAVIAAVGGD